MAKNKGGRPKKPSERKSEIVAVRFEEGELLELGKRAGGLSLSKWIRRTLLGEARKPPAKERIVLEWHHQDCRVLIDVPNPTPKELCDRLERYVRDVLRSDHPTGGGLADSEAESRA